MPHPNHTPRQERDLARGRRAFEAAIASGKSALEAALDQVDATFQQSYDRPNALKLRVEHFLRIGAGDPETRARYGGFADRLGTPYGLDRACTQVECWLRREGERFRLAGGWYRRSRLDLDVLTELRLILRWMRFKRLGRYLPHFADVVTTPAWHPAPATILPAAE